MSFPYNHHCPFCRAAIYHAPLWVHLVHMHGWAPPGTIAKAQDAIAQGTLSDFEPDHVISGDGAVSHSGRSPRYVPPGRVRIPS